jgi:hypothetical protein
LNSLWIVLGISFGCFSVIQDEFGLAILDFGYEVSFGDVTVEVF